MSLCDCLIMHPSLNHDWRKIITTLNHFDQLLIFFTVMSVHFTMLFVVNLKSEFCYKYKGCHCALLGVLGRQRYYWSILLKCRDRFREHVLYILYVQSSCATLLAIVFFCFLVKYWRILALTALTTFKVLTVDTPPWLFIGSIEVLIYVYVDSK